MFIIRMKTGLASMKETSSVCWKEKIKEDGRWVTWGLQLYMQRCHSNPAPCPA